MAGTVLVKDVMRTITGLLQQPDGEQFVRWPETELVRFMDHAQLAIAKYLPSSFSRIDAIKLKAGTRQSIETIAALDCKPGDGSTPDAPILGMQLLDVVRNMGSDGLTPGRAIQHLTDGRSVLDEIRPMWHTATGSVISTFTHDPRAPRDFYVSPAVTGSVWAEIIYSAQPLKIPNTGTPGSELYKFDSSNTTKLSVSDDHEEDVVNYCCARALMKNAQFAGNGPSASAYAALFMGSLNAKVAAITGNNPNLQRLPFAPEPIGAAK